MINIKIAGTFFRNENVILVQGSTQAPDRSGKTDQINDSVLISLPAPFDTPTMHDAGLLGIGFLVGAFFVLLVRR